MNNENFVREVKLQIYAREIFISNPGIPRENCGKQWDSENFPNVELPFNTVGVLSDN
jgi:hypothetical protein